MVTGGLTSEFQLPLVTQCAGNPCSEGAALALWGKCPGSALFTPTLPSPVLMAALAVTDGFGFCVPFLQETRCFYVYPQNSSMR